VPWDLVVIDEAHKLRNAHRQQPHRPGAEARTLTGRKKLLLTATPLQNSLMELYGLSTLLDEHLFGDEAAFRKQFMSARASTEGLARRALQTFAKRTLRRRSWNMSSTPNARHLPSPSIPPMTSRRSMNAISAFWRRKIPTPAAPQRHLTALILRKLLASSSHAVVCHSHDHSRQRLERLLLGQGEDDGRPS
jgi:hypothetical protein